MQLDRRKEDGVVVFYRTGSTEEETDMQPDRKTEDRVDSVQ
jgi:hypothetical protein